MGGDLSIAVAIGAGLLSFLSPCVLPLVPAYLGQLATVAVVGRASGWTPGRGKTGPRVFVSAAAAA